MTDRNLDAELEDLARGARGWSRMDLHERGRLLHAVSSTVVEHAEEWVRLACAAKGLDERGNAASEEWLAGPVVVLRHLRQFRATLAAVKAGRPLSGMALRQESENTLVRPRVPLLDAVRALGVSQELWLAGSSTPQELADRVRATATGSGRPGEVCAVLGAGNVSSIGPLDVLSLLLHRGAASMLKMNPVNAYLAPVFERAFSPLVRADLLRIVKGGPEVGAALVHHGAVDGVHLTGSGAVHDAIVWGGGPEASERRARGEPLLAKSITSELGCVSPVIVVPGAWKAAELTAQVENVATMVVNNASFNCNAAQVLVTAAGWPQREAFLAELERVLASIPARRAYYPGARERHAAFVGDREQVRRGPAGSDGDLPWTLCSGLDPESDDPAFREEAFCGVVAETALPEDDAAAFLPRATRFCNRRLFGTLSGNLLIDPRTAREVRPRLEQALGQLEYGTVAVNTWAAVGYFLGAPAWGAYPGHTLAEIGSGIGSVHETSLVGGVTKSIVRAPFRSPLRPAWFATHRRALDLARAFGRHEARFGIGSLTGLLPAALRG